MERETLDVDVLIVGGGPAGLSAAIRLAQLQKARAASRSSIAVLEKAREAGAHMLSGAVLDPRRWPSCFPTSGPLGAPLLAEVARGRVYFLSARRQDRAADHPAAAGTTATTSSR